jgi:hypothetical protein
VQQTPKIDFVLSSERMRFRRPRLLLGAISSAGAFWLAREAWITPIILADSAFYAGLACLAALALLALVIDTAYFRAGAWMWLAIASNAIGLQLIEAGKLVRYQHLRLTVQNPGKYDFVFMGLIGIQMVLVGTALLPRISHLWRRLATRLGIGSLGVAVSFLCLMVLSGSPLRNLFGYGTETLWMSVFQLVQAANLYLVVSSVPRDLFTKWAQLRRTPWPRHWVDPIAMAAAVWVFLASGFLALVVWENHPHIPDEVAYLYQAQYFSQGMLTGSPTPVPRAFEAYLIDCQDRCLSITNPGWPAMLALGHLIKAPWLINPVLAAVTVFLLFHFLRRLYDLPTARLATCLLAISPWYLFLAMSFMTHSATLFAALAAALFCLKMREKRSFVYGIMAGLCIGAVSLIRPLDGAVAGGLIGTSVLFMRGYRIAGLAAVTVGMALTGSLSLLYNQAVTGDPMASAQVNYFDQQWGKGRNAMGFGPNRVLSLPGQVIWMHSRATAPWKHYSTM